MDNIREHIYLAALLHDIGKFYQRADRKFSDKYNSLSEYSKKLAEDICPVQDDGKFGYQHVIWTNEFFEKTMSMIESVPGIKQNLYGKDIADDSIVNFACNHHCPKTELQAIVTMADCWSAGMDRRKATEVDELQFEEQVEWGKERNKQIPLYSIFNTINGGKYQSAFGLHTLTLDDKYSFPHDVQTKENGVSQKLYADLWVEFVKEFSKLPFDSMDDFRESLLFLLKKYTWCIPSNTMDMSNVSLFDHLKTTAAFADCLYQYKQYNPEDFSWNASAKILSLSDGKLPVMLLGGDLSGIQKFIYNIASRKASVSLKGRSFYLQLLIDSVIQRIVNHKDINCSCGQVVYSSGGKFYMLLPNTNTVVNAINELRDEFEKSLWDKHHGQLLLNLDYVPFAFNSHLDRFSFENIKEAEIGDLWKCLADKLNEDKSHKFTSILHTRFDDLFTPQEVDEKAKVCSVTGIESSECVKIDDKEKENPVYVLPIVKEQAKLGNALKDASYIVTCKEKNKLQDLSNRLKCSIEIVNTYNYLFDQLELTNDHADYSRVKMINKMDFLNEPIKGKKVCYGFQFYGGNKQAMIMDENSKEVDRRRCKTFEELSGNTYLGILRMDVDSLGSMFIKGLPKEVKSFAAYSTLSFMLDYFFSGYLNTIRKEYEENVNILYSGGDDIFAIGKWDQLICFAREIRSRFAQFVGREDISISGGITIVNEKYPISKAAQLAGDAEDEAKTYFNMERRQKKNAFNIFGENISWSKEFDFVKGYKNQFLDLCNKEKMPRSILHRLMILCSHMRKGDMGYIWHTVYFLKRFSEDKSDRIKEACEELLIHLCDKRKYELIAIAARWAELELRIN